MTMSNNAAAASGKRQLDEEKATERLLKYVNLARCTIKMIDDDTAGYVFCITPENGRGSLMFAVDTEKERAKFTQKAACIQHVCPSIDDFETLKVLGKGHYGRVILARPKSGKQSELLAIKEMKITQVKSKILYAERSVMEHIGDHPFISRLEFALARGQSVFLIFKFMAGGDLFLHMQNNGGSFSESVVQFYGAELLLALEHMHRMHILHRDIKPENILLGMDGHIKLADMGLAKRLSSHLSRTNTMCGTDTYLPPEMVARTSHGHGLAVDLWQFGCLLFELRAGYPPFYLPQSSQKATHQRILHQNVRYPTSFSSSFTDLLSKLLVKKQEDRMGYTNGISELRSHPFFAGLNWDKLQALKVPPPILPGPAGENLVANFDRQFTQQRHNIENDHGALNRDFAGFDYVCPQAAVTPNSIALQPTRVRIEADIKGKEENPELDLENSMVAN